MKDLLDRRGDGDPRVAALVARRRRLEKQKSELEVRIADLEEQLKDKAREVEEGDAALRKAEDANQGLRRQLDMLEKVLRPCHGKYHMPLPSASSCILDGFRELPSALLRAVPSFRSRSFGPAAHLSCSPTQLIDGKQDVRGILQELDDLKRENRSLKAKIADMTDEDAELRAELDDLDARLGDPSLLLPVRRLSSNALCFSSPS